MKLICDGLDLSDAINKVCKALPQKAINPVFEGIMLSAKSGILKIYATDTEIAIEKTINAEIIEDGDVLIMGRFFSEYIKKLTDEQVELFTNEKNELRIKYGDSEGFVKLLPTTDYPTIKELNANSTNVIKILQRELKDSIEKTIFAVSTEDSRPILKGCLFEYNEYSLTNVALDGYRIAINTKPLENKVEEGKIVIPARSLTEIAKLLGTEEDIAELIIDQNYMLCNIGTTKVTTRLLNGEFINYKQIIPEEFVTNIIVNKKQLEDSLDRASLPSRQEKNNLVKFEIKEKNMTILGTSEMSNIKENIGINLKGKDINIAFNARFIADCLRVLQNEFIKISFTSSVSPTIITPSDTTESIYLVLPVRMIN